MRCLFVLCLMLLLPGPAFLSGCGGGREPARGAASASVEPAPPPVSETWDVMGTFAAVRVPAAEKARLARQAEAARRIFDELNSKLSTYRPDSEISRINASAGVEAVRVSPTTLEILRLALRYHEATGGAFEPTLGPLVRAWGFGGARAPARLLDAETVRRALTSVGISHLHLADGTAFLDLAGMSLDLGGIAKGFAVDRAYGSLAESGAENFLIDLGGNMRCRGASRGGSSWTVGVRNPFRRGDLLGVLHLGHGLAVATSGNYEQFVTIEGRRYTHIIDPRTGLPCSGMAGVTVVSETATEADALSTALFVLGPREGAAALRRLKTSRALFVPDRKPLEILISRRLRGLFAPAGEVAGSVTVLDF